MPLADKTLKVNVLPKEWASSNEHADLHGGKEKIKGNSNIPRSRRRGHKYTYGSFIPSLG